MSLKQEIETWVAALGHYDNNEFDESLKSFDSIADTSKILFNCGVIHATLGEHEKAVDCYQRAVRLDQYLAVAYFQQGVSNFLMGDFEEALANFNDTLLYLRGNNNIDYEQLGLKFKLYSCEVLFNRGLCYIYLQQKDAGMQDLSFAAKEKVVPDHDVIDEAIREEAEGYTVFSIPVGIVYRPNQAKVKNLKTKDYLGKARLVAASDRANAFTGFAGTEMKRIQEGLVASAKDDRPEDKLSFAATNLVKPGLASRSRQQSEPPISRNMFPPTPPPETETRPVEKYATGQMTRAQSVRGGGPKPQPLELGRAAFELKPTRTGTQRSASERPRTDRDRAMSRERERERGSSRSRDERADRSDRSRRYQSDEDSLEEDVYDMYQPRRSNQSTYSRNSKSRRPMYIEEEDEDDLDDDIDGAQFEMVSRQKSRREAPTRSGTTRRGGTDVSKIRVKVHAEDTRYVLIDPNPAFAVFADQIRTKFGIRKNFKIKIKDEDDMITMADQDDLDMATMTALASAKREKADMAKMEVWIQEV
ncbi:hypothetical protein EJ05DRAFT_263117 [Pseudovirgaria hyperparasitica]|uniref:Uncharacterized protein n=1 Tax=Pseudovirgaria hyperparasitica TaxID=470096 RepID=A0A6A6WHB7_9PEZI|nr:uncharacterized protein EJ05DRAFT_263117 [Pseudovirgaria hyperparasitica]KAF2761386.1 hypothetical protein EJ05DRAFT_263117 [Pseudovirgaria hyperparasitica]